MAAAINEEQEAVSMDGLFFARRLCRKRSKRPPLTRGLSSISETGGETDDRQPEISLPPSRLAPCHLPRQREAGVLRAAYLLAIGGDFGIMVPSNAYQGG